MEWKVIMPVIGVVLGAVLTGAVALISATINNAHNRKLEKIKIHTSPKFEALRRLMLFATRMRNNTFPLAENKLHAFLNIMNESSDEILSDALYFDEDTQLILDEFDNNYVCSNSGDLISETHDEVSNFIENELFKKAGTLRDLAKKQANDLL